MRDIGVAPTDSTVTVSDPAKQSFLSVDDSGVVCCFMESGLMLGPGVDGPTLDMDDGAVCIEGPTL